MKFLVILLVLLIISFTAYSENYSDGYGETSEDYLEPIENHGEVREVLDETNKPHSVLLVRMKRSDSFKPFI